MWGWESVNFSTQNLRLTRYFSLFTISYHDSLIQYEVPNHQYCPFIYFSYWMGAQQMPAPIYQYRIILPFDESVVNVATDMDFNVEGEVKMPIAKNILAKSSFLVSPQAKLPPNLTFFSIDSGLICYSFLRFNLKLGERKSLTAELEVTDESSATQLQYTSDLGNSFAASYMQAVTPSVTVGGTSEHTVLMSKIYTSE